MAKEPTGLRADAKDLAQTLRDYAKQETLGPLKGIGRYLGYGIAGAVCMAIALVLLVLATLRALQTGTGSTFQGNLSWLPYVFLVFALLVVVALLVKAVTRQGDN
jgi:hypothetical protein